MNEPYAARHARLLAAAEEQGIRALILYTSGLHSFVEMDPVWYGTGFKSLGPAATVIAPGIEPVLLLQPEWDLPRGKERASIDVRPSARLFADLAQQLRAHGVPASEVGVCGVEKLRRPQVSELDAEVGVGWRDFDESARQVAVRKDEHERELVRRASWIAEEGYRHALEEVRPGMREFEFAGRLDVYMRELGADDNFLIVSASQHNYSVHSPGDRIFTEGDILLAEISPSFKGAFAQICRSAVIGNGGGESLVQEYELLRSAFMSGLKACLPGSTMGDVVKAVNEPIESAGFAKYCAPPYMRTRGHGMGIGSPFPISVAPDSPIVLQEGMTFVLHPNQYLPSPGYLLCGDHVAIRHDGAEPLSGRLAELDHAG